MEDWSQSVVIRGVRSGGRPVTCVTRSSPSDIFTEDLHDGEMGLQERFDVQQRDLQSAALGEE